MAETPDHRDVMIHLIEALRLHFSGRRDVYISGNDFLYWEEGNPKARISPDVYAVFGVPYKTDVRRVFKVWEERGQVPRVVFEATSRKTKLQDIHEKKALYEQTLKVPEYFLFDPTSSYLHPRLQGYRLASERYVPLEPVDGRLESQELGLILMPEGRLLRLLNPRTNGLLPTPEELRRMAESEAQRAESEAQRAESEAQRAASEAQRADVAEAEVARLRAALERLRGAGD
jgi:Uma2 family endonuclease